METTEGDLRRSSKIRKMRGSTTPVPSQGGTLRENRGPADFQLLIET